MTQHDHKHGHDHQHHQHGGKSGRGLHKDWRTWAVVILMLVAMAIYVLSDDERFQPGKAGPQQAVPAAP